MSENIRKKLGVIDLEKKFQNMVKYRVPTGIIAIDRIIQGGVPSGKLTEISGGFSAGKSRLLLHILVNVLKMSGLAMLVDKEHALEKGLADVTGLDYKHENFLYPKVEKMRTVEQIFDLLEKFIKLGREECPDKLMAFAIDSVAAMPTEEDIDGKIGVPTSGARRAKIIGDGIRKYISMIHESNICFICVNQLRDKIGVMYGEKDDTPGGRAIEFHASLRLRLDKIKALKDDQTEEQIATKVRVVCKKSKIGIPFGMVKFEMPVMEPISKYAGLWDYMQRHEEVVHSGGAYYYFPKDETKKFTKEEFVELYEANKPYFKKQEEKNGQKG